VLSLADRYEAMKASAAARVCSGKSAIHGLGVFAKVPHKAGMHGGVGSLVQMHVAVWLLSCLVCVAPHLLRAQGLCWCY
jgi:hypothetical protein